MVSTEVWSQTEVGWILFWHIHHGSWESHLSSLSPLIFNCTVCYNLDISFWWNNINFGSNLNMLVLLIFIFFLRNSCEWGKMTKLTLGKYKVMLSRKKNLQYRLRKWWMPKCQIRQREKDLLLYPISWRQESTVHLSTLKVNTSVGII